MSRSGHARFARWSWRTAPCFGRSTMRLASGVTELRQSQFCTPDNTESPAAKQCLGRGKWKRWWARSGAESRADAVLFDVDFALSDRDGSKDRTNPLRRGIKSA